MSDATHNEHLLSAYLDGELNQDERLSIEKMIAENPVLEHRLQQWRAQGDSIRSLPKFELSADISSSVLANIRRQCNSHEVFRTPLTALKNDDTSLATTRTRVNWRNRMSVASALAGMILVGLFFFSPERLPRKISQQFGTENSGIENQRADLMPGAAAALGEANEPNLNADPSLDFEAMELGFAAPGMPSVASNSLENGRGNAQRLARSFAIEANREADDPEDGNFQFRSAAEIPSIKIKPELTDTETVPPTALAKDDMAIDSQSRMRRDHELRPESKAGEGRANAEIANVGAIQAVPISPQPVSIPQIFIVDFHASEQPLAIVSEVFSRNQIEILTPTQVKTRPSSALADRDSPSPPLPADESGSPIPLQVHSSVGMEALYVVASRSQLSRAMDELASWADISGFQINSELLTQMSAQQSSLQNGLQEKLVRMDDLIAQSATQSGIPFRKSESDFIPTTSDKKLPREVSELGNHPFAVRRAMAQQLQPIERSQRQLDPTTSTSDGNTEANARLGKSNGRDPLEQMIYSTTMNLSWNYSRVGRNQELPLLTGRTSESASDANQELVQFLLFIRTKPVAIQPAAPLDSPPK